jgi:HEAT repeat protein
MTNPIPFQSVVDALLETGKPFPKKYLTLFSDIDSASLSLLLGAWPRISLVRKQNLLDDLASLMDKDTIVSFEDFAHPLFTDPDAQVRAGAIRLLAECENTKLIPAYIKMLASDPEPVTRAEAAETLGLFTALGELEEIPEAVYHRVEDALLAASRDADAQVRRKALESLGYSLRPEIAALIESAYNREDPDWIASALKAMGRSNDDRWSDEIIQMLLNEESFLRLAAVKAAGELGLSDARQPLLHLLDEEEDRPVFLAAIWALSQIGGEDVQTFIINLADQTEDEEELDFFEDALANLAFTEDLERLDLLALDPDLDLIEDLDEEEDE